MLPATLENYQILPTSVPGIGVGIVVEGSDGTLPFIKTTRLEPGYGTESGMGAKNELYKTFALVLVKTGPLVGTGTIHGSDLPSFTVIDRAVDDNGTVLAEHLSGEVSFNGSLNISSSTCQLARSSIDVQLGEHAVSSTFKGKGSSTAWEDIRIDLINCPAAYGSYNYFAFMQLMNSHSLQWTEDPDGGVGTSSVGNWRDYNASTISYSLQPTTDIVSNIDGLFALDPDKSKDTTARGIGIQVVDENEVPVTFNTRLKSGIEMRPVNNQSYSIKLKARYLQYEDRVTGGDANASMIFNIFYE